MCTCEWSFSKLKIVKSTLKQTHLESLILIAVEKKIACKLKNDKESIINRMENTSSELSELLLH